MALSVFGKELGVERQSQIALLLLLTCIVFEILGEPFREPSAAHRVLKRLELSALLVEYGTLWCGLMIYQSGPKSQGLGVFLTVSVILINMALMLWLALVLSLSYLENLSLPYARRLGECLGMRGFGSGALGGGSIANSRIDEEPEFESNVLSTIFETADKVMDNPLRELRKGHKSAKTELQMVSVDAGMKARAQSGAAQKTEEDTQALGGGTGSAEGAAVLVVEHASLDRRKFMRYETDQGQSYYVEVGSQVSTWELPPDGEVVAG